MRERADPRASGARPEDEDEDDDGQGGSAAAEFAVLLPVYMTLIVVTLTMGQFVLIRQKVAMTAHLQAWMGNPGDVTQSVFQSYTNYGNYAAQNVDPPPPIPTPDQGTQQSFQVKKTDFIVFTNDLPISGNEWTSRINEDAPEAPAAGGGGNNNPGGNNQAPPSVGESARYLATLAFLDGATENGQTVMHPHLEWRAVHGSFSYLPAFMPAMLGRNASINPGCTCVCLARKPNVERKVYRKNGGKPYYVSDRNPIEDVPDPWSFPISRNPNNQNGGGGGGGNQDNTDYRFLPPDFPSQAFNEPQVTPAPANNNGGDPGIWNTDFRIGGSEDSEWTFFKQQLGL